MALAKGGGAVRVFKTLKANGENAQVSYSQEIKSWIICSKNVSLAARKPEDLVNYQDSRFNYAKLIAETFFGLISHLPKEQQQ